MLLAFWKRIIENPVFLKELRIGLREKKVFFIHIIYLFVLGLVCFFFLMDISNRSSYGGFQSSGREYFKTLCVVQWFMVVLISPSLTGTSISSEKEKSTFDLLIITLLGAKDIIIGKLAFAMSYILLLLTTSLPLIALVFLIGGVSPLEIIINYLALFLWGFLISLLGLFFSSREHRSSFAINQLYGAIILAGFPVASIYIAYVWDQGLFMTLGSQLETIIAGLIIYFIVLFTFFFLYYKISNNITPRAKTVLSLHNLFIIGFFVVFIAFMTILTVDFLANAKGISNLKDINTDNFSAFWAIFVMASVFFMGSFVERRRFISPKDEDTIMKSVTAKPLFFPLFFSGFSLLAGICLSVLLPTSMGENLISAFFCICFLFFMVYITRELYILFKGKIRPVFIYFVLFSAISLLPVISWSLLNSLAGSRETSSSILSFIFLQPIFSILSIWEHNQSYSNINLSFILNGLEIPTLFAAFTCYFVIYSTITAIRNFSVRNRMTNTANTAEKAA